MGLTTQRVVNAHLERRKPRSPYKEKMEKSKVFGNFTNYNSVKKI
jgi:hypothetical protein